MALTKGDLDSPASAAHTSAQIQHCQHSVAFGLRLRIRIRRDRIGGLTTVAALLGRSLGTVLGVPYLAQHLVAGRVRVLPGSLVLFTVFVHHDFPSRSCGHRGAGQGMAASEAQR